MNPSKCNEFDYINFLIASTKIFTCTEAARCQLLDENSPSHDAFTRLLQRQPPDTEALWKEVQQVVRKENGFLILDDSTLDKPYSRELTLVYLRQYWKSQTAQGSSLALADQVKKESPGESGLDL